MRTKIERWTLIGFLALSYGSRVPGLLRQGSIGIPALIVGLVIASTLIVLLLKGSSKAALVIACMSALGAFFAVLQAVVIMPIIRGSPPISPLMAIPSVIAAYCAMDLWSAWRTAPNQSSQPTRAAGG